jgi:ubiquitin carboxyl-terminal hydrolase 36/42
LPPEVVRTSFVHQVFGGTLQSQVKCHVCGYESNTYDPFLDISVGINGSAGSSLEAALSAFVKPDQLTGDNKYMCSRCQKKVDASKRFTVHELPLALCIQLKRFNYKGKINRPVPYPQQLDMNPYTSKPKVQF